MGDDSRFKRWFFIVFAQEDLPLLLAIVTVLVVGVTVEPFLPEQTAPHFGPDGQPTRYEPRWLTVWLLPLFTVVLLGLMNVAGRLDAGRLHRGDGGVTWRRLKAGIIAFMLVIYGLLLYWNYRLGHGEPPELHAIMPVLLGLGSIGLGRLLAGSTLPPNLPAYRDASPAVIRRVNRRLGYGFVVLGILILATLAVPQSTRPVALMVLMIGGPLAILIWAVVAGGSEASQEP